MLVGVGEERLAGITVKQGQRSCQGCRVEITSLNSHFAQIQSGTRYMVSCQRGEKSPHLPEGATRGYLERHYVWSTW